MDEPVTSRKKIEYNTKYNADNVQQFKLNLNKKTDADIIDHLSTKKNKQGYVKELIRKDMN